MTYDLCLEIGRDFGLGTIWRQLTLFRWCSLHSLYYTSTLYMVRQERRSMSLPLPGVNSKNYVSRQDDNRANGKLFLWLWGLLSLRLPLNGRYFSVRASSGERCPDSANIGFPCCCRRWFVMSSRLVVWPMHLPRESSPSSWNVGDTFECQPYPLWQVVRAVPRPQVYSVYRFCILCGRDRWDGYKFSGVALEHWRSSCSRLWLFLASYIYIYILFLFIFFLPSKITQDENFL